MLMLLTKLYVRFYKSFNFDYERKTNSDVNPRVWEAFNISGSRMLGRGGQVRGCGEARHIDELSGRT